MNYQIQIKDPEGNLKVQRSIDNGEVITVEAGDDITILDAAGNPAIVTLTPIGSDLRVDFPEGGTLLLDEYFSSAGMGLPIFVNLSSQSDASAVEAYFAQHPNIAGMGQVDSNGAIADQGMLTRAGVELGENAGFPEQTRDSQGSPGFGADQPGTNPDGSPASPLTPVAGQEPGSGEAPAEFSGAVGNTPQGDDFTLMRLSNLGYTNFDETYSAFNEELSLALTPDETPPPEGFGGGTNNDPTAPLPPQPGTPDPGPGTTGGPTPPPIPPGPTGTSGFGPTTPPVIPNRPPIAVNDLLTSATEDNPAFINLIGNDRDPDGDAIRITSVGAGNGTVQISGGGVIYTPNPNFNGTDTITYTIADPSGATSTATATIQVAGVNDVPQASGTPPTQDDFDSTGATFDISSFFTDPDTGSSAGLTFDDGGTLPPGLAIDPNTGIISGTVDPNASAGGPYDVTITATDPSGASVTQTFTWNVTNPPPIAENDDFDAGEDDGAAVVGNVLGNDSDPDNDAISTVPATGPGSNGGTFGIDDAGEVTFDPGSDFNDLAEGETTTSTFTYTLVDADGDTDTATITVTVTGVNDAPVPVGTIGDRTNDDSDVVTGFDVSGAFDDPDTSDDLTFTDGGTLPPGLSIDPNTGIISGAIDKDASTGGTYPVVITATDPTGATTTQTFDWTVENPPPEAENDDFAAGEDDGAVNVGNVLGNDSDPDGDALSTVPASGAGSNGGTFSIDGSGNVTFNPGADFQDLGPGETDTSTFTYTLQDADGATDTATITVTVTGVNDPPEATPSTSSGDEDTNIPVSLSGTDIDGTIASVTVTTLPPAAEGTLFYPDGTTPVVAGTPLTPGDAATLVFTPAADFNGTVTIPFTVTDNDGATSAPANEVITVNPVADPTVVGGDTSGTADEDNAVTGTLTATDGDGLTDGTYFTVSGNPANGSAAIDPASGSWSYTPNDDYNGNDSFEVTITDDLGNTTTQTIDVTNNPVVDIADDTQTTDEDTAVTTNVLTNDSFEGTPSITAITQGTNGTVTNNNDGTLTYTPTPNFNGTDSYTYTVTSGGVTETATVNVTVNPTNDPTTVGGDTSGSEDEDAGAITGTLTATDPDGLTDGTYFTVTGAATNGSASIDPATGAWSYTPNDDYNGADSFTVTITDDAGNTTTQAINLTVNPVVDIADDTQTTDEDTAVTTNVLTNDSFEGTPSITAITQGTNGTVTNNNDGTLTYTPNANFSGTDSYTYTVTSGGVTETATVNVTVNPVNDPTTIGGDTSGSENEDGGAITGTLTARDPDGLTDGTYFTVTGAATNGTASIDPATGAWSYTPNADYNGADSFTVTVSDDLGNTTTQAINLTVNPVVDIANDAQTTNEDTTVTSNVLTNDSFEGTPSITAITQGSNGTVTNNNDGTLTYTPNANFSGTDSYTYTVTSGGVTETATVNVTVNPVNDPTVIGGDTSGSEDEDGGAIAGTLTASDPDGLTDGTYFTVTGAATNGSASIDPATGAWSYTPNDDYNGPDSFEVTITDDLGNATTQAINLTVNPIVDIANDTQTTDEDTAVTTNVLTNDSFEGTPSITAITQGTNGTVTNNNDGTLTYTPNPNFNGTDSYTYTVTSGGVTETATVNVTVNPTNDPTTVGGDTSGSEDEDAGAITGTLTATDPDGLTDGTYFTVTGAATNGSASIDPATGAWSYTPNDDYNGPDSFTVTVTDDLGNTTTQAINLTVNPVVDIADDTQTTDEDTAVTTNVLTNDSFEGTPSITVVTQGSNGTVTNNNDGTLTYTPNANFNGTDSYTYTVTSGGVTETATVNVTVNPANDPTTIGGDTSGSGDEDEDGGITGTLTASDPDGLTDGTYFTVTGAASNGTASINPATGAWSYLPNEDYNGADSFTVTVTDDLGNTTTQAINLTVNPVVDIANDTQTTDEDTAVTSNVLTNDTFEGTPTITGVTNGSNGTVTIVDATTGTVQYTPNANFNGTDSYTYTVTSGGVTETATVNVTVNPANDPTVIGGDTSGSGDEDEDGGITGTLTASDPDGLTDGTYFSVTGAASNGTASINPATGAWSYLPNEDYNGADSFTVTVTDDLGNTTTQAINLTVNPVVDIANDTQTTNEDTAVTSNVLTNDSFEGTPSITAITQGTNGTVTNNNDGTLTYTPNADFSGTDSYTYTVTSGGVTETATVNVTVNPTNDPTTVGGDTSGSEDEDAGAITGTLTATDPDGLTDGTYFTVTSAATNGSASIDPATGAWSYTPNDDYNGPDSFTVTITDDLGNTTTQAISLTVNPIVDIADDTQTTDEDTAVTTNVLTNDSFEGTPSITAITQGTNGTVTNNNDGTLTYTPNADFNGTDSYTYTVTSGGVTETATVNVTVNPVNDPPIAVDDYAVATEGTPLAISILSNDSDPDDDPLNVCGIEVGGSMVTPVLGVPVTLDSGATVTLQADGTLLYETAKPTVSASPLSGEVVFLAGDITNASELIGELNAYENVFVLDADGDSVEQMAAILNGATNLDAIHILSHGEPGELQMGGSTVLDDTTANGVYADELAAIGSTLSASGDILIYGCDVADTPAGEAFVETLATLTGADVAASTDDTGHSTLGGDWVLEDVEGSVEAAAIDASNWVGELTPSLDLDDDNNSGASGSDFQTVYTEDSPSTPIVDVGDVLALEPDGDNISQIQITLNGPIADGSSEILYAITSSAVRSFPLDGDSISSAGNVGGTFFRYNFDAPTSTLTITHWNQPTMTLAEVENVLEALNYTNSSHNPTTGDRVFDVTITDENGETATAQSTVNVVANNDAPVISLDSDNSAGEPNLIRLYDQAQVTGTAGALDGTLPNGDTFTLTGGQVDFYINDDSVENPQFRDTYSTQVDWLAFPPSTHHTTLLEFSGGPAPEGTLLVMRDVDAGEGVRITAADGSTPVHLENLELLSGESSGFPTYNALTGQLSSTSSNYRDGLVVLDVTGMEDITIQRTSGQYFQFAIVGAEVQYTDYRTTFTEDGPAVAIADIDALARDVDDSNLESATITLTNPLTDDRLLIDGNPVVASGAGTSSSGVVYSVSADGYTITLGGTNTLTDYATAIESISFENTSDDPDTTDRTIHVTVNDGEANSNTAVATIEVVPVDDVGAFDYLDEGETANDSFVYKIDDGVSGTDTATVYVTINGVDDPTVTAPDSGVTDEDSSVTVAVLANDSDPDTSDNPLSVTNLTQPPAGKGTVSTDGTNVTFNPGSDFQHLADGQSEVVTFTYDATTPDGDTVTETVTITVNGVNDPTTVGGNTSGSNDEDAGAITGTLTASDPEGLTDGTYFTVTGAAANGSASINPATGDWSYTPNADYNGNDSFEVTITDDAGNTTTQAINLTVNPIVDIADDTQTTNEDTAVTSNVLTNDSFEGTPSITAITQGSNGTVTNNNDGTLTYTPNANFNGTDSYTYTVTSGGVTETATVNVTVNPINDPTVIGGDTSGSEDEDGGAITGTLTASDPDGLTDGTYFTLTGAASNGSASIDAATGAWSYTPNADYNGADSFTVTITDDLGNTTTQAINLTVNPVVDIANDSQTTDEDTAVTSNVLTNDSFEGTPTITGVTNGSNGTVTIVNASTGTVQYTPNANFSGTDSYTYTVTSGGVTETATVNVTVNPVNSAPNTHEDCIHVIESKGAAIDVIQNDEDAEQATLTITEINGNAVSAGVPISLGAGKGSVIVLGDGRVYFDPMGQYDSLDKEESATETFTYTVSDGVGGTATETVTVAITGEPDANATGAYQVASGQLNYLSFDPATETFSNTPIGPVSPDGNYNAMGINPADGQLYAVDSSSGDLIRVDSETGDITLVTAGYRNLNVGEFNPEDGYLYATQSNQDPATWHVIDVSDGSEVRTFTTNGMDPVADFAYDPVTQLFWGAYGSDVYSMDSSGSYTVYPGGVPSDGNNGVFGAAFSDANGNVAVISNNTGNLYFLDTATGQLTYITDATPSGANDGAANYAMASYIFSAQLALDPDSSTGGNGFDAYRQFDTTTGTPVSITDSDIQITDFAGNGVASAQIALRDPQAGDSLNIGALPGGIAASTQTVGGQIIVTLTGAATAADYETAIGNITFDNGAAATSNYPRMIDVTIVNGQGATSTATSKVFVTGGTVGSLADQTADSAIVDQALTTEDQTVTVNVMKNDSDEPVSIASFTQPGAGQGSVTQNVDGTFTFDPGSDYNSLDFGESATSTFTYTTNTGDTETVTVTIYGVEDAPLATDNVYTGTEDINVTGNIITDNTGAGADSDPEGDSLSVTQFVVSGGAYAAGATANLAEGDLTINSDGSFTFVPATNFNGTVPQVTYTLSDGTLSDTATVNVTFNSVNDTPVSNSDAYTVFENDVVTTLPLQNDSDPEGGALTITELNGQSVSVGGNITLASGAVITLNAGGTVDYTANSNFWSMAGGNVGATDSFTYTVSDENGGTSTETVEIVLLGQGESADSSIGYAAPDTAAELYRFDPDTTTVPLAETISTDSMITGEGTAYSSFTNLLYVFNGLDLYSMDPDTGAQTLIKANALPEGSPDDGTARGATFYINPSTLEETFYVTNGNKVWALDPATGDVDPDGFGSGVSEITINGAITNIESLTVDPDTGVAYVADDRPSGAVDGNTENVDIYTLDLTTGATTFVVGTNLNIDGEGLAFANDGNLYIEEDRGAVGGRTIYQVDLSTGNLTPAATFGGTGDLEGIAFNAGQKYIAPTTDLNGTGEAGNNFETTYGVGGVAESVADSDVDFSAVRTGELLWVRMTLTNPQSGDQLSVDTLPAGISSVVETTAGGEIVATLYATDFSGAPVADFETAIQSVQFSNAEGNLDTTDRTVDVLANDGNLLSNVGTTTIHIITDPPTPQDDVASGVEDSSINNIDVLANDTDPDSDPLTVTSATALNGSVAINVDGSLNYTPNPDFNGTDTITYVVEDPDGHGASAEVTVTVSPLPDPPDANDDSVVVQKDTPTDISVLANDVEPDGENLTITSFSQGANGTVTDNGDGTLKYTPSLGFTGTDTFTYQISDGASTDTATVNIDINEAPVAADDTATTDEDSSTNVNVLSNDNDPDLDPLTITEVNGTSISVGVPVVLASGGTITLEANGTLTYDPNGSFENLLPGDSDSENITYVASDGNGATDSASLDIAINGVNDGPTIVANTIPNPGKDNTVLVTTAMVSATDPDHSASDLTYAVSGLNNADFQLASNGSSVSSFTQADIDSGLIQFESGHNNGAQIDYTLTVSDPLGATDTSSGNVSPVVLDMDGDGAEFDGIEEGIEFDVDGDGQMERTAWANEDDAVLIYDGNQNGQVDGRGEFAFADYAQNEGATDLEGLREGFDSDGDLMLTAQDAEFDKFALWQDADGNGVVGQGEFQSLSEAGIESIGLVSDGIEYSAAGGDVLVHGQSQVQYADGSTGVAADASFAYAELPETVATPETVGEGVAPTQPETIDMAELVEPEENNAPLEVVNDIGETVNLDAPESVADPAVISGSGG